MPSRVNSISGAGVAPACDSSAKKSSAVLHVGFVLTGVVTTLLGPVLPILSARWALRDVQAGNLFVAQFAGSMLGVALSGLLLSRRGFRSALSLGYLLIAAGVAALGAAGPSIGLAAVFCYGLGLGFTIPATNLAISDRNPDHREAALNVLNLAWGIGAVACPFLVSLATRAGVPLGWLWGLAAALGVVAAVVRVLSSETARQAEPPAGPGLVRRRLWSHPVTVILGILFFVYVGTETAVGGWVASYAKRVSASAETLSTLAPAFFWGALLAGRALAPAILRRVTAQRLVIWALLVAFGGVAILVWASTLPLVLLGASLAGVGLASVFPITIASLSYFGPESKRVAGPMFALSGLGGATLPWLVGLCSTHFASLRIGLAVPLLGAALMLVLQIWKNRRPIIEPH